MSAALVRRYRNLPIKYWKPIQTGIEQDDDSAEVQRLSGCGPGRVLRDGIRLPRPVSPHLAAKLSGTSIAIDPLIALGASMAGSVLIVSRSGLGTINHTLLTIEALGRRAVPIAGVVMVGPVDDLSRENRLAIEHYGHVAVLGEMPVLNPLTPDRLRAWAEVSLDADGRLGDFL